MTLTSSLHQLALLIRLPNSFTVLSNVLAAYYIGTAGDIAGVQLGCLVLASWCFYHGGIVLNDCLDIKEDRLTQPHRPLASGAIALAFAWTLVVCLFVLGLASLYPFGDRTMIIGVLLVVSIVSYNLSSRDGLLGCFIMGLCRGLNWLLVLTAVGAAETYGHYALLVAVYVMSLTFLSRDEEYAARPWLAWLSVLGMTLASVLFLVLLDWRADFIALKLAVYLLGLALVFYKLTQVIRHYTSENLRSAVMFFVIGLIPLDACLLLVSGYPFAAAGVLLLMLPSKSLARRLYVT